MYLYKNNVMNIKGLIKEEIINLINETYTLHDNRLRFKQKLSNATFENNASISNDFDTKIIEHELNIGWSITLKLDQMGVENFIVEIDGVEGNIKVEMRDKQSDKVMREDVKDINDYNWKFVIDNDVILKRENELYIDSASFDFNETICHVLFTSLDN